jgi:hypothetical protein
MRLALISPLALTHKSLEVLLVANLQLKPALDNSVRRGMNAELEFPGMQSSKKLVSTRGHDGLAILISEHNVMKLSLPQLSQTAISR